MGYSDGELNDIHDKNDGYCWWCGKKLSFVNYGRPGAHGAWEVDHSNPVVQGGSDYFRNLVPALHTVQSEQGRPEVEVIPWQM